MHFECLVEEPSAEAALDYLLPRILGEAATFAIHPYQGKQDLLNKLPERLRGYARWLPDDAYVLVLIDQDNQDCRTLKRRLELIVQQAGLRTKTVPHPNGRFQVINRIAIEELEAWFFGDADALRAAYPRLPDNLENRQRYRQPDAITGGTWEALADLLVRHNYFRSRIGFPKIDAARSIAVHMNPAMNRSPSFCLFRDTLQALIVRTER